MIFLPDTRPPVGRSGMKSCSVCFQSKSVARLTSSAMGMPLAVNAPISAPMLVPTMARTGMAFSASGCKTPICARPAAPPPLSASTRPVLFAGRVVLRLHGGAVPWFRYPQVLSRQPDVPDQ